MIYDITIEAYYIANMVLFIDIDKNIHLTVSVVYF